ncbi:MAG: hypothetical protein QM527_15265 [Alphaproteobacteria bacterium]|nr:hypothetical protein [Alphaproteobacteria bacterium]
MNSWPLTRRQFIQVGAVLGAVPFQLSRHCSAATSTDATQIKSADPFWQLAWRQNFQDHDPWVWPEGMRLCLQLPRASAPDLERLLGDGARIQTLFHDVGHTWTTLWCSHEVLHKWQQKQAWLDWTDHLWGAPWSDHIRLHPERAKYPQSQAPIDPAPASRNSRRQGSPAMRWLMIDHGFPWAFLDQEGVSYLRRDSGGFFDTNLHQPSISHGAQVLGLWLSQARAKSATKSDPLLLYALPDQLMGSMPLGALWPDVVDAVGWALQDCSPGSTLNILLSVVSTDGDRHPNSFVSRCARSLNAHADALGVRLRWIMAAGNSHSDRQNLRFEIPAGQTVEWEWHLPPENLRSSLLECWHDASAGPVRIQMDAPGQATKTVQSEPVMASRTHSVSGRIQTVLRLPPTAVWDASKENLAQPGAWRIQFETTQACVLDVHLSLMADPGAHLYRQAWLQTPHQGHAHQYPAYTVSGLVPWVPNAWAAQCLRPGLGHEAELDAKKEHLSHFSGRWPQSLGHQGLQSLAIRVDESALRRGALTLSANGHRWVRATGTSMAVPLAAHWLSEQTNH